MRFTPLRKLKESLGELAEVDGTKTGDRVPAGGGVETVLAAAGRSTVTSGAGVVTLGDIVESLRVGGGELVENLVQETKRLLASIQTHGVDQGDHTAEDRGRGRGSGASGELLAINDDVVVAEDGDIRITTAVLNELIGGGQGVVGLLVVQVGVDSRSLPSGLAEDSAEATASSDTTTSISSAGNLSSVVFGSHGGPTAVT